MYTLVFSKIEGGIRDTETVFAILQSDFLTAIEHRLDRTAHRRTYQLIMHLEIAETQWQILQGIDISRIKHGNAIDATKHQTAVWQLTRSTVAELVASQSVGLIERCDAARLGIQTVQTLHRANPQISLRIFFYATHIRTRQTANTPHLVGLWIIT